ncbi:MAG TPA: hypothetical protein DD789_10450, partial [Firmicutes bacterium]|nr:hypothetical protein [Bacillota bacterium]
MKDRSNKVLFIFGLLTFAFSMMAIPIQAANLSCQGSFQSQMGVSLEDDHDLTRLETELVLQPEVVTADARFYGEVELNSIDVVVNEAYLDLYGFPHRQVDLRLGKQLLPWGTGYQLNPTSNLNPEDFRSPFDFGRR